MYAYIHMPTCIFGANYRLSSHNMGDDGKKEICMWGPIIPGHRAITAHHQMLLLVSIACISHWLFNHPPHKSYFTICQLFPKALECPLDILCGFAQSKHAPQACGLYFLQGFLAAITY